MAGGWYSSIIKGSAPEFDYYVMSPEEQHQDQFLAPPMDRNRLSGSSRGSRRSMGSSQDQNYPESPLSSNAPSEGGLTPQYSYFSPETAEPSRESSTGLPPFNIEKDGDPRISWRMYYDFVVTKTEAYFQLQPDYIPTDKYPSRVPSEKVIVYVHASLKYSFNSDIPIATARNVILVGCRNAFPSPLLVITILIVIL
jgi:hypothetical protein